MNTERISAPANMDCLTIAVVEDDEVLREELCFQLNSLGFTAKGFDGANALYRFLATERRVIAILDIGLEGEDGLSICEHLRSGNQRMGLILATARGQREDRLEGLSVGADAYLVKPIDVDELILHVKRLANRILAKTRHSDLTAINTVQSRDWSLDSIRARLKSPGGGEVPLTLSELALVSILLGHNDEVCTFVQLAKALDLLPDELDRHRLEVIVSRMQKKVVRQCGVRFPIRSVRNQGYIFSA